MQSFVKIRPSRNGEITLSFTNIGKSCLSCEFLTSYIYLLRLFAKIKFSRKFPNVQYKIRNLCKIGHKSTLYISRDCTLLK